MKNNEVCIIVRERNKAYEWLIEHDMSPVIK